MPAEETERFRPWVQMAVFCQNALKENTGNLSIIRVIERVTIPAQMVAQVAGQTQQPLTLPITLVVVLKSGFMKGSANIGIRQNTPSGKTLPPIEASALFEGDDRGIELVINMGLQVTEEGLYWFDVLVNSELFTRVPLRVLYQQIVVPGALGIQQGPPMG
jgi:hypothetical protein